MAIKILTQNGVDNTNIDGARTNNFNAGNRSGFVKGAFNDGRIFASTTNTIALDTCELRLSGHQIVITEIIQQTFNNAPPTDLRLSWVAEIKVADKSTPIFRLFVQDADAPIRQDKLFATEHGGGTYQLELCKFTHTTRNTIEDIVRTADVITGGIGSGWVDSKLDKVINNETLIAHSQTGFAAGMLAKTISGGVAIGAGAKADGRGSVAIGSHAKSYGGVALGEESVAKAAAINAWIGGAVGAFSKAGLGFSGGYNAKVKDVGTDSYIDAIQLGTGTNNEENTMQVYDHKVMGADGELYSRGEETATKTDVNNAVASKQDKLTAGENITIVDNVISATGGGGTELTPQQIENINNVPNKQDKLIAGENITIGADGKTISATGGGGGLPEFKPEDANKVPIVNATADGFNYVPKKGVKAMSFPAPSEANNGQFLKSNGTGLEYADAGGGEDPRIPTPTSADADKVIKVNASGNYELGESGGGGSSQPYVFNPNHNYLGFYVTDLNTTINISFDSLASETINWGDGTIEPTTSTMQHTFTKTGAIVVETDSAIYSIRNTAGNDYAWIWGELNKVKLQYSNGFNNFKNLEYINGNWSNLGNSITISFEGCNRLKKLPTIDSYTPKSSMWKWFYNCYNLEELPMNTIHYGVTSMERTFTACHSLKRVPSNGDANISLDNLKQAFYGCESLEEIDLCCDLSDLTSETNISRAFWGCWSLKHLHFRNYQVSFDISSCQLMGRDALLEIINNLSQVTTPQTLTMGATLKNRLTAEDIQIATAKGWTIA